MSPNEIEGIETELKSFLYDFIKSSTGPHDEYPLYFKTSSYAMDYINGEIEKRKMQDVMSNRIILFVIFCFKEPLRMVNFLRYIKEANPMRFSGNKTELARVAEFMGIDLDQI